jgi:hypothetical protein
MVVTEGQYYLRPQTPVTIVPTLFGERPDVSATE